MLAVIGAVMAVPYFYQWVDDEVRRQVERRIAEHYAGLEVSVRKAELVEGGIAIHGLSIAEPGAQGPRAELIHFDEIRLDCPTDWQELLSGKPKVTQITIRRPSIWVTRRGDGTWSVAKLLPVPKFCDHPPPIAFENGTVEIFDPWKTPASTLTLRNVNLTLDAADPTETAPGAVKSRKLRGSLSADHAQRVELEGWVDPDGGSFSLAGSIEGLDVSPQLRGALPDPMAAKMAALGELHGRAALQFRVAYNPADSAPWRYETSGRIAHGRLAHPRLPHPLTDLRAAFCLDDRGIAIDDLVARSNQTKLRLSARQEGLDPQSPKTIEAEIRQLELDQALYDRLTDRLKAQWRKYSPAGQVDADVKLRFDGRRWHSAGSVRCLNVSFTHHKFPYRLNEGRGILQLKDDCLQVNLTAFGGNRPVQIDGEVASLGRGPTGWVEISGDDLPVDAKLLGALKEKPREFVRSLNPSGTINFHLRLWREQPGGALHKNLFVGLNRCSIRYEKFSYPLNNIRGTVTMRDDLWTFQDLEGTNDTGRVACQGYMTPPQPGQELVLRFAATDVPLEEELRDALKPNIRRAWNDLKPQGTVDLVADVKYLFAEKKLSVGVRAEPRGDTTSIEPVRFPYRMEKVKGLLIYEDGHVTLQRFRARHGPKHAPVKIAADGSFELLPDGCWSFELTGLSVDRMPLDGELIGAMPERVRKAVLQINPTGQIDLRGSFAMRGGARPGGPIHSHWDLVVGFHQATMRSAVKLENINGVMTAAGAFDGRNFYSTGELDIDSISFKDVQFTQVMGPIWIDDRQALLGSWVAQRVNANLPRGERRKPRRLTAKLFGGTVSADKWVAFGPEPRYGVSAQLSDADLSRCAQEVMAGRQNLKGKILATVDLTGSGRSLNGMTGRGNVRLRDADIYELPLMISLLKILSIRPPDTTAFSKSDIDFSIQGNHIYFNRINFNGDAISMLGRGEMDFQSNVGLNFYTIVGRGELNVPIIKELFTGASQQIMQINVSGTLQNPNIRQEAFPAVNQALQQLQNEFGTPPGQQGPSSQARQSTSGFAGGNRR